MFDKFGLTADVQAELNLNAPVAHKGRILLLDGDSGCYAAGAVARADTALTRYQRHVYEMMYLAGCEKARVHLTPRGCGKNGRGNLPTVKPYQEQRSAKAKPKYLELLRSPVIVDVFEDDPNVEIILNYVLEADDGLMIDHYNYPEQGILASEDKDLNITPFDQYIIDEGRTIRLPDGDRYGWIKRKDWVTDSGNPASKMVGKGTKFFLAQCLMGDTADNVAGILKLNGKACGMVGALEALDPITDESEAMNLVIGSYRAIKQNIIAEASAMWLLRNHVDSAYKFFCEGDLLPLNKEFLDECQHITKLHLESLNESSFTESST